MYIIVEDEYVHMKNARQAEAKTGMQFSYVENLADAYYYLGEFEKAEYFGEKRQRPVLKPNIQGVITDIHFRREYSDIQQSEAYGVEIALYCYLHGIPCVICTDVDHHQSHWIERFGEMLGIPVVVDKGYAGVAAWERAIVLLKECIAQKTE